MAWTAQAGLGPRTVALYLKVFIVVMLYAHGRLGICTAQPTRLPQELQSNLDEMIEYLCSNGTSCRGNSSSCVPRLSSIKMLCQQVCSPLCTDHCWKTPTDEAPLCRMNQNRICGYKDATVCQFKDGRGTCVYRKDPSRPFCVCQGQEITYDRCNVISGLMPTSPRPTAPTTGPRPTAPNTTGDYETNVAAIVLGSLFALLLLLVIIGVVILCLHRQGRLPFFRKQASRQLPEPPKPESDVEYAYISHLSTTKLERQADASVHEGEGSSQDVRNGQECEEITDDIKNTYFGWTPTVERKTEIEASESQGVSSATGGLPQEANIISCPLTQHIVGNITSEDGYEIPITNKQTAANQ